MPQSNHPPLGPAFGPPPFGPGFEALGPSLRIPGSRPWGFERWRTPGQMLPHLGGNIDMGFFRRNVPPADLRRGRDALSRLSDRAQGFAMHPTLQESARMQGQIGKAHELYERNRAGMHEQIGRSFDRKEMEQRLRSLRFADNDARILAQCLIMIEYAAQQKRALDYKEIRRINELLSLEPGREQNGLQNVYPQTPEQRQFVTEIRGTLGDLRNANPVMQGEFDRRMRLSHNEKWQRAKTSLKVLGGLLAAGYGMLGVIAGIRNDEPVNPASVLGFALSMAAFGGFRKSMGPHEIMQPRISSMLRSNGILGTTEGQRAVEQLASADVLGGKERTDLERRANGDPDGHFTEEELRTMGFRNGAERLLSRLTRRELHGLHLMALRWKRSGHLRMAGELIAKGIGPQTLAGLPHTEEQSA